MTFKNAALFFGHFDSIAQLSHILKLNLMVVRDHAKLCFSPERLDFVQETQVYEIFACTMNLEIKPFLAQVFIVVAVVCLCVCARVKYN